MRAACWMGVRNVEVRDVPEPTILNGHDAIVRVTSTAICGSDLHLYNGLVPAMEKGDVLGHEFMGEVVEVGDRVEKLSVGDRVVVPFPIACGACSQCQAGNFSTCENSNPSGWLQEKLFGHAGAGIYGYSHLTGGFAGGQSEFARVPFADVGPIKVPEGMSDEEVLFLSDIIPTGYFGADIAGIEPGDTVAVWGCGPVGQYAIHSARLFGAERIIAIDRFPERLDMARDRAGATDVVNYVDEASLLETLKELTGGRGLDRCIDAVGMEGHADSAIYAVDLVKQAVKMENDRPIALREAIQACRSGGTVSVIGVYSGFIDHFPMGTVVNRALTIRAGQAPVQRYLPTLLDRIQSGEIDPSFVITHRLRLEDAPRGYEMFNAKEDGCVKVVMTP
jgi:threonine dehydrogenase-like Zn-dependent dehydrogenase